jgi:hypothetical protein
LLISLSQSLVVRVLVQPEPPAQQYVPAPTFIMVEVWLEMLPPL